MQCSPTIDSFPAKAVSRWKGEVCASYTGPNCGLTRLDLETKTLAESTGVEEIAGCRNWNSPQEYAYGISLSLYEEDRRKIQAARESGSAPALRACNCIVGDPVADVFGIVVQENCCVMAVADGVNWGKKSRLAARCATHAVMSHILANTLRINSNLTTSTIFELLRESVTEKAQALILEHKATLTTLSAAIVCEMSTPGEWGLFVCAVGDSPVYVYCPHTQQVIEATLGCHAGGVRDMRMAGGVLGPNYGSSPDLSNLSYAFLPVYPGDIVFAVSDGVSDNFSSKVMGGLMKEKVIGKDKSTVSGGGLKPCCENITHLTRVLNQHQDSLGSNMSAQTVAACLINHSVEVTEKKRRLRSQCLEENIDMKREAARNPEFAARLNAATGKLDHATVVAYQVGHHHPY